MIVASKFRAAAAISVHLFLLQKCLCHPPVTALALRPPGPLPLEHTVVLLYHKPVSVVTTHATDDPMGRRNVYEEVHSMNGFCGLRAMKNAETFETLTGIRSKLHAIGRLDADTSGLLLLTNDGGLVHHVTNKDARSHAKQHTITKTYEAVIMGYHDESSSALDQIRRGVDIGAKFGGQTLPPSDLHVLGHPSKTTTCVSISLTEGRNRQIRRMFHVVNSGVMKLQRTRIGRDLTLDDLDEGCWRILTDDEIQKSLRWTTRDLPRPRMNASPSPQRQRRRQ